MSFYTYMLRCADDSYYVGHTDDLAIRLAPHQSDGPRCYTTTRRPVTLVWSQEFSKREEALSAERQIKGWSRRKRKRWSRETGRQLSVMHGARPEHLRWQAIASMLRYLSTNGARLGVSRRFVLRYLSTNGDIFPAIGRNDTRCNRSVRPEVSTARAGARANGGVAWRASARGGASQGESVELRVGGAPLPRHAQRL